MPSPLHSGLSYALYQGDGSTTSFPLGFLFIDANHIQVRVGGLVKTIGVHYNIVNNDVVFLTAPAGGAELLLRRITPRDFDLRLVDFRSFGSITEDEMDLNQRQIWFLIQEALETSDGGEVVPNAEYITWDDLRSSWSAYRAGSAQVISGVGSPSEADDAANKGYVDDIVEFGISGIPQSWTFTTGSSGVFTLTDGLRLDARYLIVSISGVLQVPNIDFTVIPGDPDSTLVFVNLPPINQVVNVQNFGKVRFLNSIEIPDGAVTPEKIQNSAVITEKIADEAVTSEKLADGAVTAGKLAAGAIDFDSLANHSVNWSKMVEDGFAPVPGGAYNRYLRVSKTTGGLAMQVITADDISDLLNFVNNNVRLNGLAAPNGSVNVGNQKLISVAAPTQPTDAANKAYVDTTFSNGAGPRMDLVADHVLSSNTTQWDIFGGSGGAPSWFTDSSYLYYTFTVSNWSWIGAGKLFLRMYQSGSWREDLYFQNLFTSFADFRSAWSFMFNQPRDGLTKPHGMPSHGNFAFQGTSPILFGPASGLSFRSETNSMAAGARVQVYGHRSLN